MIAKDYQEVYEAVSAMIQNLFLQGVRGVATFGEVTSDAESFALSIQTACHQDRVEELIRANPGKAATFLTVLDQIRTELDPIVKKTGAEMTDISRICVISGEAVLYAVKARRRRREGFSGAYLPYPKDDRV
ncbi:MAG: hypothetical protein ABSH38_01555 [Verrucomicrobiota bacterium]|jgi:hypothetical protein